MRTKNSTDFFLPESELTKELPMRFPRIRRPVIAALSMLVAASAVSAQSASTARPPSAPGPAAAPARKVNINTASPTELAYLPRVGEKVALRIVERRKQKPFARPEDLMEVKGIGEKMFLTLKPYVSVSGPTTLDAKVRPNASGSSSRPAANPGGASPAPANNAKAVPVGQGR
jgi:competence protein ComEA